MPKILKLQPPWFSADTHPKEGAPLVLWDGENIHAGIWTTRVGRCGPDGGGFATVTRKVDKNSTTTTKITLVDNIKSWMLIPDQQRETVES